MKQISSIFCLIIFSFPMLNADGERKEFLTQYEYGKALYNNPRNIGCIKCHGQNGEGAIISYIKQNGKLKPIIAPKITGLKFARFEQGLKSGKGFMPRYNLTASEMVSLYIFLNPPKN
ncbi:hypothetical protein CCY99_08405 [Helicobacter sp. 16-1353]|uniref:c-type cytochrome n=1 Tax=Helicobacter sp. 16-1353 TaxID=2004996 RepID=UPI000DCB8C41|nr:cytochrome c [Helicobacter sp. 16-1353]RAX51812.1 hypothetical protein CCY99_08405 [Helicobacter sp. 16-1353]